MLEHFTVSFIHHFLSKLKDLMQYFQLKGRRRNYKSADIYALGCCIPEMLALAFMNLTDLGKPSRSVALQRNKTLVINILFV